MLDANAYAQLGNLSRSLYACGWTTAECEEFSAKTLQFMVAGDKHVRSRRKQIDAAKRLHLGAAVVAEEQGCHRVTAYRRAKAGAKIVAVEGT